MSSTYNDIKIQLMATGDNNTTWGDNTNLNWNAMAEAVTGSADVAFSSANVTVSLTDTSASQTARNLRLNLTGTSGGARTLTVPSIEKLYLVNNGLADAVTVKTAAGTGIAVPAGKTMWVFSDATNVVDVVTALTSLTLGTALTVANGGTGAATLTGYVKGNGTSAMTASATIPTSDLSGTIAFSSITGTVPVNQGGTGQTTYTDGQLLIGNSTGNTLAKSTLTAGSGITITNGSGAITISATGSGGTVTNVTAGSGLSGGSITTTGTISLDLTNANSWTGKQTLSGSSSVLAAKLVNAIEPVTVSATAATGTINYDATTQSVLYYTTNASANWTVNLRASSGTAMNTALGSNESVTVAFLVTQGSTAYYNNVVQVDGTTTGVTTKWQGGAPSSGNASSVDAYTYTVIKTGSAAFTVLASQTKFA